MDEDDLFLVRVDLDDLGVRISVEKIYDDDLMGYYICGLHLLSSYIGYESCCFGMGFGDIDDVHDR